MIDVAVDIEKNTLAVLPFIGKCSQLPYGQKVPAFKQEKGVIIGDPLAVSDFSGNYLKPAQFSPHL
jgi:hypothetical protein